MARKITDATLTNRTNRLRLPASVKPVYRLIAPGMFIGYRRLTEGAGTWVVRRYVGDGKYTVENLRTATGALVSADDYSDADGIGVMTFAQAQQAAGDPVAKSAGSYTVADALDAYLQNAIAQGRGEHSIYDIKCRIAIINERLGDVALARLTSDQVTKLRNDLASAPRRKRTAKGEAQRFEAAPIDDDAKRSRRSSTNRWLAMFKAALNKARRDKKVASDQAWRDVGAFEKVSSARQRYLTVAEAQRLVNACEPDFRLLVQGALATGCRYGELCAMVAADFNETSGTVHIRKSKSGKARHVVLTGEGLELFRSLTVGKAGNAPVFTKSSGEAWAYGHQFKRINPAIARAGLDGGVSFHSLRHTWASLAVMSGMPLMVVAKQLGHRDTKMVEHHYGHLAPSYIADTIRQHAPQFGFESDSKVTAIR